MALLPAAGPLLAIAVAVALYVRGWRRRPTSGPAARTGAELGRFLVGIAAVLVALSPELEALASGSFAWHMVQHQLLLLVAAPLLASARPVVNVVRAAGGHLGGGDVARGPRAWLVAGAGWLAMVAGAFHLVTVLAWHLPPLYDAAMASPELHHLEHVSLLGAALLAWGAILSAARDRGARALAAVVALAMNALAGAGLGVVLLSAPVPLYGWYVDLGAVALEQQRVGGALMKVSAVVVYAGAAVWIVTRWLHRLSEEPPARPVKVVDRRDGASR